MHIVPFRKRNYLIILIILLLIYGMKQLANMSTEPRMGASQNNAENVINQTLHFIMYSQKKASRIFSNYHCRPK